MTLTPRVYRFERDIALPRDEAWELLAQTDRLNRAIGLSEIDFKPVSPDSTSLNREISTRFVGQTLRYKEYPFEWVRGEQYRVRRVFANGPFREINGGIRLHDCEVTDSAGNSRSPGVHLEILTEIVPANALGALLAPFIARRFTRPIWNYCRRYIEQKQHAAQQRPVGEVLPPAIGPAFNALQFEQALNRLRAQPVKIGCAPLDDRLIARLAEFLRTRGDDEVGAIRPFALARSWNAPSLEVLRVCLYATKAGLLNLSWNLMCPNCRVSKVETTTLAGVSAQFHCDLCGVDYQSQFDRFVELKFKVHPAIREAITGMYCIAGPFMSPHVLYQKFLEPGDKATLEFPATSAPLRLRVLRLNHTLPFEDTSRRAVSEEDVPDELVYTDEGWKNREALRPRAGDEICLANTSAHGIVVMLEKTTWDEDAATAYYVTTMPEFRMLFGSEVLAPGQHVGVETLTLFFSDLKDSTALYELHGDALAYGAVRRHFEYLTGYIERNGGSVIKTIGDAVMAVFQTPENALQAALDIQKNLDDLNANLPVEHRIGIKIGLHCGPAIAINSNDQLDYFGRTVNIAARIGGLSRGDDIALSQAMFDDAGVRQKLERLPGQIENLHASLKGIEGRFELCRWCPTLVEDSRVLSP